MGKPGSFKRDVNYSGWAWAVASAAFVAEICVRFVIPLIAKAI